MDLVDRRQSRFSSDSALRRVDEESILFSNYLCIEFARFAHRILALIQKSGRRIRLISSVNAMRFCKIRQYNFLLVNPSKL